MAPDRPTRNRFADFHCGDPFVVAVIPLHQFRHHRQSVSKATELAGSTGSLQRGAEDGGEGLACQRGSQTSGFIFAFRQQGKVGAACVASVFGPFRCSVAQEPELTIVGHILIVSFSKDFDQLSNQWWCRRCHPSA